MTVEQTDPVCGMKVDPKSAAGHFEFDGRTFYFCHPGCRDKFAADPSFYLNAGTPRKPAMPIVQLHGRERPLPVIAPATVVMVVDPVCRMEIDRATAAGSCDHQGQTWYFCSTHCQAKFTANPEGILNPPPVPPTSRAIRSDLEYTCPMDPEVRQVGPGPCPKCGMALEPVELSLDTINAVDPEMAAMQRLLRFCLALTIPVFLLAMADMLPGAPLQHAIGSRPLIWIQCLLATPVVIRGGAPFFQRAWASVVNRTPNMFTLIAIGTGTAWLYSLVATLAPGLFPASFRGHQGEVGVYFEAAAVITTLVLLGQVLELRARRQTSSAIGQLLALAPPTGCVVAENGTESDLPLEQIHAGLRLRIRPGGKVPVDGVIVEGRGTIDESMITGESMPVERSVGESVVGGTLNLSGSFIIRAERVGSETLVARIVALVSEAQRSRAPIQRLADRVAERFVPAVILISILTFVSWQVWGPEPRFTHALVNGIAVLIIACPCALGLATPMSIMVGTGRGALAGVLIREARALETLEKVDTLVLDKTGTLTLGHPEVTVVVPLDPAFDTAQLLCLAASLEVSSEHPLGLAILRRARELGIGPLPISDFRSIAGSGVTGTAAADRLALGSPELMRSLGVTPDARSLPAADGRREDGETLVLLAVNDRLAGMIGIADPVKPGAAAAISSLQTAGLRLIMLTGDHEATATAIARQLGIDEVIAGVKPDQKDAAIARLQAEGHIVAMAGDGVNDAPALARADVGIAMGTGTDIAIESSDITLVRGNLSGLLRARRLSQATMANIRQNLFFAFAYNALGIPLAAGLLYPAFGLLLSPMIASAAMTFSSVSVISNALRLRTLRLQEK
ncbi:MAG: heavy metal translocating P-type ATPase [Blastocatellia bacterium]